MRLLTVLGIIQQAEITASASDEGGLFYCLVSRHSSLPGTSQSASAASYADGLANLAALSAVLGTIKGALLVKIGPLDQEVLAALYPLTLASLGLRVLRRHSSFTPTSRQLTFGSLEEQTTVPPKFPLVGIQAIMPMSKLQGGDFSPVVMQVPRRSVPSPPPASNAASLVTLQAHLDASFEAFLLEKGVGGGSHGGHEAPETTAAALSSIFAGVTSKEDIFSALQQEYLKMLRTQGPQIAELLDSFKAGVQALRALGGDDTTERSFLQFLRTFIMMDLTALEERYQRHIQTESEHEIERIKFRE